MHNAQSIYSSLATVTIPPLSELTLVKTSKTHKTKQKQKKNGGGMEGCIIHNHVPSTRLICDFADELPVTEDNKLC